MSGGFQYIDGVGNVSVVNGMAHIDLVVLRPPAVEGQQPQVEPAQYLVMFLPNYVRLCAEMAAHLQRMEEKGLIKRRPVEASGGAAAAGAMPNARAQPSPPAQEEHKRRGLFSKS
jgi:hypothetical protein